MCYWTQEWERNASWQLWKLAKDLHVHDRGGRDWQPAILGILGHMTQVVYMSFYVTFDIYYCFN